MSEDQLQYDWRWLTNGEFSWVLVFKQSSDENLSRYCQQLAKYLRQQLPALDEVIPARESITLVSRTLSDIPGMVEQLLQQSPVLGATHSNREHLLPVCYDVKLAPDLQMLANRLALSVEELTEQHHSAVYHVDMLGFIPGFVYLSGLPEPLHYPRKETPAISVPTGSIAIGASQTGIYSLASPGGWWVIGRTPAQLLWPNENPPMKIEPLDIIRFQPISYEQWQDECRD